MLMNKLNGQEENSDNKQQQQIIIETTVTQQTKSDSPLKHQEKAEAVEAKLSHNITSSSANSQLYTTSSSSSSSNIASSANNQTANIISNISTQNLQPVNNMASSATSTSNATSAVNSGNGTISHAPNGSVSSSANSNSSASSTTSSTGINSNDSNAYFHQSFNNFKTVDLNNNSNLSTNNNNTSGASQQQQQQHSTQPGQYQGHLSQQQNSIVNAYSLLNNPYLNGGLLNSNGLGTQNQAQLLSNFYNGSSLANFNLQPNALPSHLSNQTQTPSLNSTGILNMGNPAGLLNASHLGGVGTFSDEHQAYEYLHQLLEEKEKLKELFNEPFNIMLPISAKLLDEEVSRIRVNLFQLGGKESVMLPEPVGQVIQMTEKLYVPVKDHPEFNFVGRILGPRGMTAKQLEQETGCKIMVRGKGSMRDKAKEDQMKGKPNWEHLSDELHVLLTVEDTKNRCDAKLKRAAEEIKRLLVPAAEGEDELKKKQLMELAIINGTYRDGSKIQQNKMNQILIPQHAGLTTAVSHSSQLRSPPNQMGQPLILSPRLQNSQMIQNPGQTQQFFTAQGADPTGANGQFIYATMPTLYSEQQSQLLNPQSLLEYPTGGVELSQAGSMKPGRFSAVGAPTMRAHPYARVI